MTAARVFARWVPGWRQPKGTNYDRGDNLPDGWLSPVEARCLAQFAAHKTVLEIGSLFGRSTVAMARVAHLVVSVDHHQATGLQWMSETDDTAPAFLANLTSHGVRARVVPMVGDSATVLALLAPRSFDLAFVDGSHDYHSVKRDLALVRPLVKDGGDIILHDRAYDDVWRATIEAEQRWGCGLELLPASLVRLALPDDRAC